MTNTKLNEQFRIFMRSIGLNPYSKKVEDKELYIAYIKEKGLDEYVDDEFKSKSI